MRKFVEEFVAEAIKQLPIELRSSPYATHQSHILGEVRLSDGYTKVGPLDVDLSTTVGPLTLTLPFIPAPMDTVTGRKMAELMHDIGSFGPIYRHSEANVLLDWIEGALRHKSCLIKKPLSLHFDEPLEQARKILKKHHFSTIPVVTKQNVLKGVLFTGDVAFRTMKQRGRLKEPVKRWMIPFDELKVESVQTTFEKIQDRLLNNQQCSVLPVVDDGRKLHGIYFMKDFLFANPSMHNGKPLIGMAISDDPEDLERARIALELGVGAIVIDSSHGNCLRVMEQTKKVASLRKELGVEFALIVGNIASMDGYYRLAMAGADAVKCGIGSGSICTTSSGTGIGVPMFTLIRKLSFIREKMRLSGKPHPIILPDGDVGNTGNIVLAIAAGGHLIMSGEMFVAAKESISANGGDGVFTADKTQYVNYRGMASDNAINDRSAVRYGIDKTAAEGIEGAVPYRGPLKKWIGKDIELIKGGFSHTGSSNIEELHEFGNWSEAYEYFSSFGQNQLTTRIKET